MTFDIEVRGFPPECDRKPHDVDEVVALADGECVFHLESTADDSVWFALYFPGENRRVSFHAFVEGGKLVVRAQDDERAPGERAKDVYPPPGGWENWGEDIVPEASQ